MSNSLSSSVLQLTPANTEAREAFNDVASALRNNPNHVELLHASRFMLIQPYQPVNHNIVGVAKEHKSIGCENTETETEVESDIESQDSHPEFVGSYAISLEIRPNLPQIGWVVGVGRWQGRGSRSNGGVDLQVALPRTPFSKYKVAGRHARIFLDETGSFVVANVSDRSPSTKLGTEEFTTGQRLVTQQTSQISFGKLDYLLKFTVADEENYQRDLRRYFSDHLFRQPAPPDLSATPSPWDVKLGDWIVRGTVGKGSYATVSAAKHTVTGETGAAKFLIRTRLTHATIAQEIANLKSLPVHPQILQFRDVQYERGEKWFTGPCDEDDERHSFQARPERVAVIYSPYARATLVECFDNISSPMRLVAFHQILLGIRALHLTGFIHRDIKPGNLGIVKLSITEISVVILDYGQAVRSQSCKPTPGKIGTIPYLAPEMEVKEYGQGVDMWACGVIGRQLFDTDGRLEWQNVVQMKNNYDRAIEGLLAKSANNVGIWLAKCLLGNHLSVCQWKMHLSMPVFSL